MLTTTIIYRECAKIIMHNINQKYKEKYKEKKSKNNNKIM